MIKHPREKSVCYTQLNAIFYMDLFLILYIDDFVCAWYNRPVMTKSSSSFLITHHEVWIKHTVNLLLSSLSLLENSIYLKKKKKAADLKEK